MSCGHGLPLPSCVRAISSLLWRRPMFPMTGTMLSLVQCILCARCARTVFKDGQRLQVHKMRVHGWTHQARRTVDTTFCPCCLKEFHTRTRVIAHIMAKSQVCRANLELRPFRISQVESYILDEVARLTDWLEVKSGWRRGTAMRACVLFQSPDIAHHLAISTR